MQLVGRHRNIFLTWTTILPALLALVFTIVNSLACRLIWPNADLTLHDLAHLWLAALCAGLTAAAMFSVDFYATFTVGKPTARSWKSTSTKQSIGSALGRLRSCASSLWATSIPGVWCTKKCGKHCWKRAKC